jgi:hypothetical protein
MLRRRFGRPPLIFKVLGCGLMLLAVAALLVRVAKVRQAISLVDPDAWGFFHGLRRRLGARRLLEDIYGSGG